MAEQNLNITPESVQTLSRKWKWIIVFILICAILILSALPYGIEYGIRQALIENGAEKVFIQDIDFNPFTGKLAVHKLSVEKAGDTHMDIPELMIKVSWLPMFQKRIHIMQLTISDTNLVIEQAGEGNWSVGGIVLPAPDGSEETDKSSWDFGIEQLNVIKSKVTLLSPELKTDLHITSFKISNMASWNSEQPARLDFSGRINDGALSINSRIAPFSDAPWIKGTVKLEGLSLIPFATLLSDVKTLEGKLGIDSKIEVSQHADSSLNVMHQGTVTLAQTGMQSDSAHVKNDNFSWDGKVYFTRKDDTEDFELQGNVYLTGLSIDFPEYKLKLMELQKLDLEKVNVKSTQDIEISKISANQLLIGKSMDHGKTDNSYVNIALFNTSSATISDIRIQGLKDIMIQSVELSEAEAFLRLDSNGQWHLLEDILAIPKESEPEQEKESQATAVRLTNLQILGDSSIRFEDENVTPPYRTNLALNKIQIQNIDSTNPGQRSPVAVEGKIGDYSSILLSGHIQPFAERLTLDLTGKIEEFDMPALSSYTSKHLGYDLISGHLNADITMQIMQGKMEGTNALLLKNLKVSPKDDDKIKQLTTQLTLPLDSALSLLRDKDNTIDLKLPVHGDITDPRFDFGNIINKALGSAIKKAVMTYLKLSFQPYGALITVVEIAGEAARLRLDPVFFESGSSVLDNTALKYLERVAGLMQERPQMQVSLCGKVVNSDIAVLHEKSLVSQKDAKLTVQPLKEGKNSAQPKLKEEPLIPLVTEEQKQSLAKERSSIIKSHLVQQHSIKSERLFICNPETDSDKDAKPRTELLI